MLFFPETLKCIIDKIAWKVGLNFISTPIKRLNNYRITVNFENTKYFIKHDWALLLIFLIDLFLFTSTENNKVEIDVY